ncbi:MAG: sodium-dependent transporter [Clostridia bacterium]|nr:sodium-dependent transporter [Clostridia bacterium]
MEQTTKKNGFASGIGFVLAAAGSAVGLGNLWGFPYKTSANGGAAFVLVYILCVLFMGSIAMISEIFIGKRAQSNTVTAYKKIKKKMGWIGLLVIAVPTIIVCYYTVLGGWTLRFAVNSFQGANGLSNATSFVSFTADPIVPVVFTVLFMALAALIIMAGVKNGIEKYSKILMPALFIILVGIVIFSLTLGPGTESGLAFFLQPDFSELGFDGVVAAMGQAFFSLSLGMGTMIAYGSYTGKEIKLGKSAMMICIFDTLVALLAGLAMFPAISALMGEEFLLGLGAGASGPGLIYVVLPQVFSAMGGVGQFVSFAFFAMVVIAALTSVISIMEVSVQFIIQRFKTNRKKTTLIVASVCSLVSIPIAWSVGGAFDGGLNLFGYDFLTFLDEIANTLLMPLGAFGACLGVGWFIDKKLTANPMKTLRSLREEGVELGVFMKIYAVMVKFITPILILFVMLSGIVGKVGENGPSYWWIVGAGVLIVAFLVLAYFKFFYKTDCGENADEEKLEKTKA